MRNFFYRIQNALARFMYGRNGMDDLNRGLFFVYLGVWLLQMILSMFLRGRGAYIVIRGMSFLLTVLMVYIFFRCFSKNLPKRRGENQKYLYRIQPIRSKAAAKKARKQDTAHKYFTCGKCGTVCRVPVGKGKIDITCPKCGNTIHGRS